MFKFDLQKNKIYLLFVLVLAISSCIQENDSLVNPAPKVETVKLRFMNLTGDKSPKSLVLENTTAATDIAFGDVSNAIQPPSDSTMITVNSGSSTEYKMYNRYKFSRNLNYTFVALPSPKGAARNKSCDTVLTIYNTNPKLISSISVESYFKVLNAYPDSTVSFSIALGCPNGTKLASGVAYRSVTSQIGTRSGKLTFSLVKNSSDGEEVIGLYEVSTAVQGQYLLVVKESSNGKPELVMIDELYTSNAALVIPNVVAERVSHFRTINLSKTTVEVNKVPGNTISAGVIPFHIDAYKNVSACTSITKDTIEVSASGSLTAKVPVALEVLENYSLIVMDSANTRACKAVIAEPVRLSQLQNNRAIVRVVNANYKHLGVNASIGARDNGVDTSKGFTSGDAIASDVAFGAISGYALLNPGPLPVAAFSTAQPARFLVGANLNVEANKSYILIFGVDENGEDRFTLIEESVVDQELNYSSPSGFVQIVNAVPDADLININLPGLFSNAKLHYTSGIATLVPLGSNTITINGKSITFTAEANLRSMVVACGESNNTDIMHVQSPLMGATINTYKRRFINAAKDIAKLNVKSNDSTLIYGDLGYMLVSPIETMYREKKFSLYYENAETNKMIVRIDDLSLNFGKNYSIIFTGNSRVGYGAIIQQEY